MILNEFTLQGKVALVAGDGSRGRALAVALAEAGADIALAGPGVTITHDDTLAKVRGLGRRALGIQADLATAAGARSMVERALADYGAIDILVNSGGLEFAKPLPEVTEEEWHRVISSNLTTIFLCSQAVGAHMLERKKGKIINVISGLAVRGLPNCAAYCASMGGVLQFTKALALEWARDNVLVNALGVGWVSEGLPEGDSSGDALSRYIPLRRRGRLDELGGAAVYLASDACDYITGEAIFIDGGVLAHA